MSRGCETKGPGHLQTFPVAVGQDSGRQHRLIRQTEGVQGLQGGEPEAPLPVAQPGRPQQGLEQGVPGLGRQPAEDVVQDSQA